jgi:hypothetical protein
MVFARVWGRAIAGLPCSRVGRLAFPTRPPRGSPSPTATSWTSWQGADRRFWTPAHRPFLSRHLRHTGRSSPGALRHSSDAPFGAPPKPRAAPFLSWFFRPSFGPLSQVSPAASGSRLGASVPVRPFGRSVPRSSVVLDEESHERTVLSGASAECCHTLRSFRPRGRFHLDGLLRCRPPTCCSRRRVWGSRGWLRVVRSCSAGFRHRSTSGRVRRDPHATPYEGSNLVW